MSPSSSFLRHPHSNQQSPPLPPSPTPITFSTFHLPLIHPIFGATTRLPPFLSQKSSLVRSILLLSNTESSCANSACCDKTTYLFIVRSSHCRFPHSITPALSAAHSTALCLSSRHESANPSHVRRIVGETNLPFYLITILSTSQLAGLDTSIVVHFY